jgi:hypothetical protein
VSPATGIADAALPEELESPGLCFQGVEIEIPLTT